MIEKSINKLIEDGFGMLPENCWCSRDLVDKSKQELRSYLSFARSQASNPYFQAEASGAFGLRMAPSVSPSTLLLVHELLAVPYVRKFLESVLGINYKVWQVNWRVCSPSDGGLYLHQDALGEFNLTVLLDESFEMEGSTIFVRGSHLFKKRLGSRSLSSRMFKFGRGLLSYMKGPPGAVGFFFNRTWHGRYPSATCDRSKTVLLISLFPEADCFRSHDNLWEEGFLKTAPKRLREKIVNNIRAGVPGHHSDGKAIDLNPAILAYEIEAGIEPMDAMKGNDREHLATDFLQRSVIESSV